MGDTPVATIQPNGASVTIYYVHTDHLGTPRKISRPSDNGLLWRWDPDTFGSVSPNTNPSGLGAFNYNLRFPGQYALIESGIYYNYFRDYDPQMGRYIESDPIGLAGGSWSTYAYANGNPISNSDPDGEQAVAAPVIIGGIVVGGICSAIPSCRDAAINAARAIQNACSSRVGEQEEDKNCEALYQSALQTCASLKGRKRFACFEAARENREQCYRDKGKAAPLLFSPFDLLRPPLLLR